MKEHTKKIKKYFERFILKILQDKNSFVSADAAGTKAFPQYLYMSDKLIHVSDQARIYFSTMVLPKRFVRFTVILPLFSHT